MGNSERGRCLVSPGALGGAGARAAGLVAGGFAAAAEDDRAVLCPPPDDFAACPELAPLELAPESLGLVRPLVFDGFSGCFAAICGGPGCVRAADCVATSGFGAAAAGAVAP